jgi:ribosomal protein S18 acetylase RimI-like enzyme
VPHFLAPTASPEHLEQASLHALIFWHQALDSSATYHASGIHAIRQHTPHSAAFLVLETARSHAFAQNLAHAVAFLAASRADGIMAWPTAQAARRGGNRLAAHLLAHGFERNWQTNWMWLDLQQFQQTNAPSELQIIRASQADLPIAEAADLPYHSMASAQQIIQAAEHSHDTIQQFYGFVAGQLVAQSVLHLTYGARGIASIRNIGVVPSARRRGYGAALTCCALQAAQAAGCQVAMLSATDEGAMLYHPLGFRALERTSTWYMHGATRQAIAEHEPTPDQLLLRDIACAIGSTNTSTLKQKLGSAPHVLNMHLPSGLTLIEVAAEVQHQAAAALLWQLGAFLDIPTAWKLGWHQQAAQLLEQQPSLANTRHGIQQITPLHIAAWQNDLDLARLLLSANADRTIQDATFHATPLGWAQHFGHSEMIVLLTQS